MHAGHEAFVGIGGEADVTFAELFVELGGIGFEFVDVALEKVAASGVEGFEVAVEGIGRDMGVERKLVEVENGKSVGDGSADTVNVELGFFGMDTGGLSEE